DYFAAYKYAQLGVPARFSACPFDRRRYPYLQKHRDVDVSFVGRVRGKIGRADFIRYLHACGIDVFVPGGGVEENRRIPFDQMLDLFARSKVNLEFAGVSTDGFLTRGHRTVRRFTG